MGFLDSAIGAVAGGILGGSDANSGPAGTTTKTNTGTTSSMEDIPDWLKSYFQSNLSGGTALRDSITGTVNPLYGASEAELGKTIGGDYLDPSTNPYLAKTGDIIAGKIGRTVDSRFESAGRYGSGAHQELLSEDVGNALNALYGANYNAERGRQLTTAQNMPAYATAETNAKFLPFLNLARLIPNLKNTTSTTTGTATEPYFRNKGAGILGGALAGGQLGNMFGGGLSGLFPGADPFSSAIPTDGLFAGGAMDPELAALIGGSGGEAAGAAGIEEMLPLLLAA